MGPDLYHASPIESQAEYPRTRRERNELLRAATFALESLDLLEQLDKVNARNVRAILAPLRAEVEQCLE